MQKVQKNGQGFSLVELMIVVAIVGILAAIAIPQFAQYRIRAFNANAKGLTKVTINVQSDLSAELGCYGHSEAVSGTLVDVDAGAGAAMYVFDNALASGATKAIAGGRLVGTNLSTGKQLAVPNGIGVNMALDTSESGVTAICVTGGCSYVSYTRADNGDTVYGFDSDIPNILFSVSNPGWPAGGTGINTALPATDNNNDIEGNAGGGQPTITYERFN